MGIEHHTKEYQNWLCQEYPIPCLLVFVQSLGECLDLSKESPRVPRFVRICVCEEVKVIGILSSVKFNYQYRIQRNSIFSFFNIVILWSIPWFGLGCREVTYDDWTWFIFYLWCSIVNIEYSNVEYFDILHGDILW